MKQEIIEYLKKQIGDDDPDMPEALYNEYCNAVAEKLHELEAPLVSGDFALMGSVAHALKGNAAMVGDNEIYPHALAFEKGAKNSKDLDVCKAEFAAISNIASQMKE